MIYSTSFEMSAACVYLLGAGGGVTICVLRAQADYIKEAECPGYRVLLTSAVQNS